jgi:hypothetical protein
MSAQPTISLNEEDDQLTVIENLNTSDETALQRVVDVVNGIIGTEHRARVTVLTDEQWKAAIERSEIPHDKRKAAYSYLHVLRNPNDPQILLVSRTAAQGINERIPSFYAEVVYLLVGANGEPLSALFTKGVNDLIAQTCSRHLGVDFFTNNHPLEANFVAGLISCLRRQWSHEEDDWALLLKRKPEKFFTFLERSQFIAFLASSSKRNAQLQPVLASKDHRAQRSWLVKMMRDERMRVDSEFASFTISCIRQYHEYLNQREGGD